MSDAETQALFRLWTQTRSVDDEARYLAASVRAGTLTSDRVELAALLGYLAACRAIMRPVECVTERYFWAGRAQRVTRPHPPLDDPLEAARFLTVVARQFARLIVAVLDQPLPPPMETLLAACERFADEPGAKRKEVVARCKSRLFRARLDFDAQPLPMQVLVTVLRMAHDAVSAFGEAGRTPSLIVTIAQVFSLPDDGDPSVASFVGRVLEFAHREGVETGGDRRAAFENMILRGIHAQYVPRLLQYVQAPNR